MSKIILFVVVLTFFVNGVFSQSKGKKQKHKLTAIEAVQFAERFIIENGYTDLSATKDKSKIIPESITGVTMQLRFDSLQRKAYGCSVGHRRTDDWVIIFKQKYKKGNEKIIPDYENRLRTFGRAVTMNIYGGHIRMEHQGIKLEFPGLVKLAN